MSMVFHAILWFFVVILLRTSISKHDVIVSSEKYFSDYCTEGRLRLAMVFFSRLCCELWWYYHVFLKIISRLFCCTEGRVRLAIVLVSRLWCFVVIISWCWKNNFQIVVLHRGGKSEASNRAGLKGRCALPTAHLTSHGGDSLRSLKSGWGDLPLLRTSFFQIHCALLISSSICPRKIFDLPTHDWVYIHTLLAPTPPVPKCGHPQASKIPRSCPPLHHWPFPKVPEPFVIAPLKVPWILPTCPSGALNVPWIWPRTPRTSVAAHWLTRSPPTLHSILMPLPLLPFSSSLASSLCIIKWWSQDGRWSSVPQLHSQLRDLFGRRRSARSKVNVQYKDEKIQPSKVKCLTFHSCRLSWTTK